jgi:hypothetical protein
LSAHFAYGGDALGESVETMRKRPEFAMNERQQKVKELEQILSQVKGVGVSGVLHSLLGDSTTHLLQLQQMQARIADINSQIRSLDFEIDTLRSGLSSSFSKPMHYQIAGALTVHRFTCPNCGVSRSISEMTFERMKKDRNGMCKTCFTPFKVNVDETTDTMSFECLKENPTFHIHSPLLNTDLAFTENLMPDHLRQNLLNVAKQLENGGKTEALKQLENVYASYPAQVSSMLISQGLSEVITPFTVACPKCGVGIPRTRLGNCPICKATVVQKKTAEDPMQILKLRLAKGEISKEEYEDLKKSVES